MFQSEKEMYLPIKEYLEQMGYEVKAEVKDCDILAYREEEFTCVEMKLHFTLQLLYQAVERQRFCKKVYVAIPYPKGGVFQKDFKKKQMLCRCLKIGLLLVRQKDGEKTVKSYGEPAPHDRYTNYRRSKSVKKEFLDRKTNINQGGITNKPIMTAYREESLLVCEYLFLQGESKISFVREVIPSKRVATILQRNVHGWFERTKIGVYRLTEAGLKAREESLSVIQEMKAKEERWKKIENI